MNSITNIIFQIISGGFTGYITNTYAINMLFTEYTPLKIGGVIKKTKEEFIENISELVERDIINHKTLGKELEKDEFRDHIEEFVNDLLKNSLYSTVKTMKFQDINGFEETIGRAENFIDENLEKYKDLILNSVLKNMKENQIPSKAQIDFAINDLTKNLRGSLEENKLIDKFIDEFMVLEGNLRIIDIIGPDILNLVSGNIENHLNKGLNNLMENEGTNVEEVIENLLNSIDYDQIIKKIQDSIGEKKLKHIISSENQGMLVGEFKESINKFFRSVGTVTLFENLVKELIKLLKTMDKSLMDLISPEFKPGIENYLRENIPLLIEKISQWIKENSVEIEKMIQETIDETIDLESGFRGSILKIIKDGFLRDIVTKNEVAEMIVKFLNEDIDFDVASKYFTDKIIEFFQNKKISEIIDYLQSNGLISNKKIGQFVIDNIIKYINCMPESTYEKVFESKIENIIKIDLCNYFESNVKESLIKFISKKILENEKLPEIIISKFHSKFKEFGEMEIIKLANSLKKQVLNTKISGINIPSIKINFDGVGDLVVDGISKNLKDAFEKNKVKEIKLIVDKINDIENVDSVGSEFIVKIINDNLEILLKERIKNLVSENLSKLDEDEICDLVHEFMGKELKPITKFGAILGAVAGLGLGLTTEGVPITELNLSYFNIGMFAAVGLITNVLAIEMIFKPFENNRILEKIPVLKNFSKGYIVKNKSNFAKNMGKFVDEDLLGKESIISNFDKEYENIKFNIKDSIGKEDYKIIATILEKYENEINDYIYDFLSKILQDSGEDFSNHLTKKIGNIEFKNLNVESKIEKFVAGILDSTESLKKGLIESTYKFLETDRTINSFIDEDTASFAKKIIFAELKKVTDKFSSELSDNTAVLKLIKPYESSFEKMTNSSVDKVLHEEWLETFKEKILSIIKNLIISEKSKIAVLGKIREQFNTEFSEDKKVKNIFDGGLKNYIDGNLESILEKLKILIIRGLKNREDGIREKITDTVRMELGFFQKIGYEFLNGDDVMGKIISKLINEKFPDYIEKSYGEISIILENILDKNVYELRVKDIQLTLSEKNAEEIIEDFITNKNNIDKLSQEVERIAGHILDDLLSISMKKYLEIIDLDTINKIVIRFKDEIGMISLGISSEISKSNEEITMEMTKFIYTLLENNLMNMRILETTKAITKKDLEVPMDTVIQMIFKNAETEKFINDALKDLYQNYYMDKSIGDLINCDMLKNDLELLMKTLLLDTETENDVRKIIFNIVEFVKNDKLSLIHKDTKDEITEIFIEAGLKSARNHLVDLLGDINFKDITETEIEGMNGKEIYDLFNSFAGKYFTRLKAYGIFGGVFGIHIGIALLAFGAHFVSEKRNRKELS